MTDRCGNCQSRIIDDGVMRYLVKATGPRIRVCIQCFQAFSVNVHTPPVTGIQTEILPYADADVTHEE